MSVELLSLWILGTLGIASIAAFLAKTRGVVYLIGMYSGAIVITAVVSSKIVVFGPFNVTAGIIIFSVTFLLTDIISEFWGKEIAKKAVWAGFFADLLLLFVVWVAIQWEPASFWTGQEAFAQTLGVTGRIAFASVAAYLVSQSHDVWAYHFWKKRFKGKHLWLRNNLSTSTSAVIDALLFLTIAFYGVVPVVPLIIGTIAVRFIITAIDTPFIYLVRWYYENVKPYRYRKPVSLATPT